MSKKAFLVIVILILVIAGFIYFVSPPSSERASAPKKIAMLTASDLQLATIEGIKAGFKELGLEDGKDFIINLKNPKGDRELTKKMAQEIVASKPDLIVSVSTSASSAVKDADKDAQIPVVAVDVGN